MRSSVCLLFCCFTLFLSATAIADPSMPWELRNHYTFNAKNSALDYAEDNGSWRVRTGDTLLIKETHFDITLSDGRTIHSLDLGSGNSSRDENTGFLGNGFLYTVTFNDLNGLKVVHSARTTEGRPFILLEVTIQNTGNEAVSVKNVRPVIFNEGAFMNFGPNTLYRNRHLTTHGGMAVFDKGTQPGMSIFHDPDQDASIGIYVLDKGQSDAVVRIEPGNGSWSGDVNCSYEPGHVLQPGEKMTTDPVVVIYGYPSPNKMELFTAWAYGTLMARKGVKEAPRAIASAQEGQGLDEVLSAARALKGDGVTHALIPYGWEEKPGTMRGGNSYPKSIGGAASTITREGFGPGLTLDPLAVEKDKGGVVTGPDGVLWANPKAPEGRMAIATRMKDAQAAGFTFVAVAQSRIPDAVLSQFGISRAEANNLAFDVAVESLTSIAVIPAGGRAIPATREALLEAASAAGRLKVYGGRFAPLRVDLGATQNVDEHVGFALRLWPGPIEFIGQAKGGLQKAISEGIASLDFEVCAVDLHHTVSHVWQVMQMPTGKNPSVYGTALAIFPGAELWQKDDIDTSLLEIPVRLWDPKNGQFYPADTQSIPSTGEFQSVGAALLQEHPSMLGVTGAPTLYLNRLEGHTWNAGTSTLTGSFVGGIPGDQKAYVHVPAPWKFKSGKVGNGKMRASTEGEMLTFGIGGSSARFELEFEK